MRKILVVDDDALVGRMLVRRLKRLLGDQHEVLQATGAREARNMVVDDEAFVSVVSDTEMPEHDGTWLHGQVHELLASRGGIFVPMSAGEPGWAVTYYRDHGGLKLWHKGDEIGPLVELLT